MFASLPSPFTATRYHSLALAPEQVPECLRVNASAGDEPVMGLAHRDLPIHGVQFHPESVASEHGHTLLANFLALAAAHDAT
jgi:anthranilate synthase component II